MKVMYNLILVVMNKLIKYRYFILYKKALSAEKLASIFLRVMTANHSLLKKIISD